MFEIVIDVPNRAFFCATLEQLELAIKYAKILKGESSIFYDSSIEWDKEFDEDDVLSWSIDYHPVRLHEDIKFRIPGKPVEENVQYYWQCIHDHNTQLHIVDQDLEDYMSIGRTDLRVYELSPNSDIDKYINFIDTIYTDQQREDWQVEPFPI